MRPDEIEAMLTVDDRAGPARPLDDRAADALIAGALDRVFPPGGGGAAGGGVAGKLGWFAAGLAVLVGVGVATWLFVRPPDDLAVAVPDAAAVAAVAAAADAAADAGPAADAAEVTITVEVPAEEPRNPAPKVEKVETPKVEAKSAQDLLAEANAARKRRDWKEADRLYGEVVARHGGTGAAQAALVASATIRLEHLGDARGAIRRFREALSTKATGALAEEARFGLAEAHRATGDRAAEARALDEFLRHHGDSPLADTARARRAELP